MKLDTKAARDVIRSTDFCTTHMSVALDALDRKDAEIAALREENERLKKCHDAELGVCQKYCEEIDAQHRRTCEAAASKIREHIMPGHWTGAALAKLADDIQTMPRPEAQ